jgi:hypothetical protein
MCGRVGFYVSGVYEVFSYWCMGLKVRCMRRLVLMCVGDIEGGLSLRASRVSQATSVGGRKLLVQEALSY